MKNRKSYTPQEVAELMHFYHTVCGELEIYQRYIDNPNHDTRLASQIKQEIYDKYHGIIPQNILDQFGIDNFLDLGLKVPQSLQNSENLEEIVD